MQALCRTRRASKWVTRTEVVSKHIADRMHRPYQKNDFSLFSVPLFAIRQQSLLHSNPNNQRHTGACGIPSASLPPSWLRINPSLKFNSFSASRKPPVSL